MTDAGTAAPTSDAPAPLQARGPLVGVIAGGGLLLLGPLGGLLITVLLLVRGFDAVAHADPSEKAALLSASISFAMLFTAGGLGLGVVGALVGLASSWLLLGRRTAGG